MTKTAKRKRRADPARQSMGPLLARVPFPEGEHFAAAVEFAGELTTQCPLHAAATIADVGLCFIKLSCGCEWRGPGPWTTFERRSGK